MANNQPARHHVLQQSSAASGAQPSTIRRNLFASTLSRRPTYNTTAPAASANRLAAHHHAAGDSADDLVSRDEHGNIKYDSVAMAPLPPDEAKESRDEEERLIAAYKRFHANRMRAQQRELAPDARSGRAAADTHGRVGSAGTWTTLTTAQTQSQLWPLPVPDAAADDDDDEADITEKRMKDALQAYLNRQVAALDDDAWMFGGEAAEVF